MADKYFRLVTLVVDISTLVLRELFLECVKTDTTTVPVFTTLEAYMLARQRTLIRMRSTKMIRNDQYDKIFPTTGQLDETSWDVSLLSALLTGLFGQTLLSVKQHIVVIREVRNSLQHKAAITMVSDTEFDSMWNDLKLSTCALANRAKGNTFEKEIETKVDSTVCSYMPGLGDTLRHWYVSHCEEKAEQQCEKLDNLQKLTEEQTKTIDVLTQQTHEQSKKLDSQTADIKELQIQLAIVQREGNTACTILERVTVKRPATSPTGKPNKRFQTVDHLLERFRANFQSLIKDALPLDFTPPPEYGDVRRKLQDNHRVVVAGNGMSSFLQTALYAIKDLEYESDRCALVTQASDWNHIEPGEIDLVLFRNPFGETDLDSQRAKAMVGIYSNITHSTKAMEKSERIDVVMVTKSEVLQKMVKHTPNSHAVLEDVVTVYNQTSSENPDDLVTDVLDTETLQQPLQNLVDMTSTYLGQVPSAVCDSDVLKNARENLRFHKAVVLTGNSKIGKQTMLYELSRSYEQDRCLLLTNADDLRYVQLNKVLLLIVEDLAESSAKWMRSFNMISALVDADKLKVIITATEEGMKACIKKYGHHSLLEHHVRVPEPDWTRKVKQETLSGGQQVLPTSSVSSPNPVQVSSMSTNQNQSSITTPLQNINISNVTLEGGGQFEEGQAYNIRDKHGNSREMHWTNGEFVPFTEPEKSNQTSGFHPRANISAVAGSSGENSGRTAEYLNERTESGKQERSPEDSSIMASSAPRTTPDNPHALKLSRTMDTGRFCCCNSIVALSEAFLILSHDSISFSEPKLATFSLTEMKIISNLRLPNFPTNRITKVSRECVAAVSFHESGIRLINVSTRGQLSHGRTIQTGAICADVAYSNGLLFGLFYTPTKTMQIRDMSGSVMKSFDCDFSLGFCSLSVSPDSKYVYISDSERITKMDVSDRVLAVRRHEISSQKFHDTAVGDDGALYVIDRDTISQMDTTSGDTSVLQELSGSAFFFPTRCISTYKNKLFAVTGLPIQIREYTIFYGLQ